MPLPGPRAALALVLGLGVVGLLAVGPNAWVALASRDRVLTVAEAPARPVAIVLGAGLEADGTPSPYLAARLDVARALYEAGKVEAVLVSGSNQEVSYDEPTAMRDYLVAAGMPAERVVADFAGLDTYDTCVRARRIFSVGEQDAVIVSQGYHLPRAVAICRATGLDVVGVGDWTAQQISPGEWSAGRMREKVAALKAAWDVLSRRDPILGEPEDGLREVLEG